MGGIQILSEGGIGSLLIDFMQRVGEGVLDSPESFPAALRLPGSHSPPLKPNGSAGQLPSPSTKPPTPCPHHELPIYLERVPAHGEEGQVWSAPISSVGGTLPLPKLQDISPPC